jgi:hypothetical protein
MRFFRKCKMQNKKRKPVSDKNIYRKHDAVEIYRYACTATENILYRESYRKIYITGNFYYLFYMK